jgi:uncharacterized membrane protein YkoI
MKMLNIALALSVLGWVGCKSMDMDDEQEIPLNEVPAAAVSAAEAAVEGIVLGEAEVETEKGQTVYSIEGEANGKEYDIEVTADGTVLEIEEEGDDKD